MRYACMSFLFSPGACHYMRLSLLFLHSVSFAVASVLQMILFAVRLPGEKFLYLWYSFTHAGFVFFRLSVCGVTAAFTCLSSSLFSVPSLSFPTLVVALPLLTVVVLFLSRLYLRLSTVECL